jgi:hypothetical protein
LSFEGACFHSFRGVPADVIWRKYEKVEEKKKCKGIRRKTKDKGEIKVK